MRRITDHYLTKLLFTFIVLFFLRCSSGVQKGQYSVSQTTAASLSNDRGMIAIIKGRKLDDKGNISGDEFPLLYFLAVLPEKKFTGFGAKNDNGKYESLFEYSWFSPDDPNGGPKFVLKITCDRENDVVNIYEKKFNRGESNAFLILYDKDMNPSVKQYKGLNSDNEKEVFSFFKNNEIEKLKDIQPYSR